MKPMVLFTAMDGGKPFAVAVDPRSVTALIEAPNGVEIVGPGQWIAVVTGSLEEVARRLDIHLIER